MYVCMYVQFSIKIFQKLVPVILVTIIRLPYYKTTINRQLIVHNCMNCLIKPLNVTIFCSGFFGYRKLSVYAPAKSKMHERAHVQL